MVKSQHMHEIIFRKTFQKYIYPQYEGILKNLFKLGSEL